MEIKGQNIDIDGIVDMNIEDNFHIYRGNDIYLSNYQVSILERNNFNYKNYNNLNSLIFDIDNYLNDSELYDEELEKLLDDLSELNYYNNTNK